MFSLTAVSPIDGRYSNKVEELSAFFSEAALIYYRVYVEIEWFVFICNDLKLEKTRKLTAKELKKLRDIYESFTEDSAARVKEIESVTNHDVKAVEYFIKEHFKDIGSSDLAEFVHFGSTSEDISNLSYGLMIHDSLEELFSDVYDEMLDEIEALSEKYKKIPMLSRTHGQAASPTTVGKEFFNVLMRLERQVENLLFVEILGKINGAVGNYNAHLVAYPDVDWIKASNKFVTSLGLIPNLHTTQIEPHDYMAEIFDAIKRINTILIDFNRDIWTYISMDYFKQKLKEGEIGSSTMPHKVNPIDFENSEGNLGMANALFAHFSEKLPISRMQRDLTDSTVQRNIGSAFAYSLIAYKSFMKGLKKLEINEEKIEQDLDNNWEILAEPIQTVMRKNGIEKPYEKLKELTRGKKISQKEVKEFINKLKLPKIEKDRLLKLTPAKYIGLAIELIDTNN